MSSREHIYKIAVEEKKKKKRKEILTASRGSIGNTQIIQITLNIITPPPPPPKCVALVYLTHFVIGAMSQAWLRKRKTGPGRKQAEKKKPDIIVRRPDTVTAENCE